MMRGLKRLARVKLPEMPRVSRRAMVLLWLVAIVLFVAVLWWLGREKVYPLLQTRGEIANRQRDLLVFATMLSLLVIVPVYYMLYTFAWRYRDGHKKVYKPNWDTDKRYEAIWWGIPIAIIGVLAVVTWVTSHSLDPYKPLASNQPPLKVQVIALQWKWLFVYPEEEIASVGEVVFPAGRPVEFTITSDAPMNSFWIPQLAGQIYAMSGMSTKLHVAADVPGEYDGLSSNLSGAKFADMKFTARAMNLNDYTAWVQNAQRSDNHLTWEAYKTLAQPGTNDVIHYRLHEAGIYDRVIMKYMHGDSENEAKPTEQNVPSQMKMGSNEDVAPTIRMNHDMEGMH